MLRTGSLQSRMACGLACWVLGLCICVSAHETDPVITEAQINKIRTASKALPFYAVVASDSDTYTVTFNDESTAATVTLPFVLAASNPGLLPAATKSALLVGFLVFTVLGVLAMSAGESLVRAKRE